MTELSRRGAGPAPEQSSVPLHREVTGIHVTDSPAGFQSG